MENYYRLLYAIFNSDSEDDNKYEHPIIAYDIETDLPIAVFKNAKTCAEFFNTSRDSINCALCRKNNRNSKFRLERVKEV